MFQLAGVDVVFDGHFTQYIFTRRTMEQVTGSVGRATTEKAGTQFNGINRRGQRLEGRLVAKHLGQAADHIIIGAPGFVSLNGPLPCFLWLVKLFTKETNQLGGTLLPVAVGWIKPVDAQFIALLPQPRAHQVTGEH